MRLEVVHIVLEVVQQILICKILIWYNKKVLKRSTVNLKYLVAVAIISAPWTLFWTSNFVFLNRKSLTIYRYVSRMSDSEKLDFELKLCSVHFEYAICK